MSRQELETEEFDQQVGPNWTLIIVGYFAVLAVVIVILRPLHMSMGGIFFSMVIAGIVLALIILGAKRGIRKVQAMGLSAKDAYRMSIGYNPYRQEDEEEESGQDEPSTFIDRDPLFLSETFQPSFHSFLAVMCLIVGIRRSGKSTLLLALITELAKYSLPFVLFDTQGEFIGLVNPNYLQRPRLAGKISGMGELPAATKGLVAAVTPENAYSAGQAVMTHGLQLVVHLKSYSSDDEAALVMSEIVDGVNVWQEARPNRERVPSMFFLSEAQKWFPQNRQDMSPYISTETQNLLEESFIGKVVERGGKNGLGLVAETQRYSRINKSLLQSQWKFYLQQTEEIDLARYKRQGIDPDEAKNLRQGEVIAFGPGVTHFTFKVVPSDVPHEGHTPDASALAKYTRDLDKKPFAMGAMMPDIPQRRPEITTGPVNRQTVAQVSKKPRLTSQMQEALDKYHAGFTSARELGPEIGVKKSRANEIINQLRTMGLIEQTSDEESTEELINE